MASSPRGRHSSGQFHGMAFTALEIEDGHGLPTRINHRGAEHPSWTDKGGERHTTQAVLRSTIVNVSSPGLSSLENDCNNNLGNLAVSGCRASGSSTLQASADWSRAGSPHPLAEEVHEPAPQSESEPLLPSEPPSLLDEQPSAAAKGDGRRGGADEDDFYRMVYRYYCARGLWCMTMSWVVHLVTVACTIAISALLLLAIDWHALFAHQCALALNPNTLPHTTAAAAAAAAGIAAMPPSLPAAPGAADTRSGSISQSGWPYAVQQLGDQEGEGEGEGEGVQTGGEEVKRHSRLGLAWEGSQGGQELPMSGLAAKLHAASSGDGRFRASARKLRVTRQRSQHGAGRDRWMLEQGRATAVYGDGNDEAESIGADSGSISSSRSSGGTNGLSPSSVSAAVAPCDFFSVALRGSPLTPLTPLRQASLLYLLLLSLYWWACALLFLLRLPEVLGVRAYLAHSLGISDLQLQALPWSAVLHRIAVHQLLAAQVQGANGQTGELAVREEEVMEEEECWETTRDSFPGGRIHNMQDTGCTGEHSLRTRELSSHTCIGSSGRSMCTKDHSLQACRAGGRWECTDALNGGVAAVDGRACQMGQDKCHDCDRDGLFFPPQRTGKNSMHHCTTKNSMHQCTATNSAQGRVTSCMMTGGIKAAHGAGVACSLSHETALAEQSRLPSLKQSIAVRVMRRENYLIALLASGLLSLHVSLPAAPLKAAALSSLVHAVGSLLGCHVYIDTEGSRSGVRESLSDASDERRGVVGSGGGEAVSVSRGGVDGRASCRESGRAMDGAEHAREGEGVETRRNGVGEAVAVAAGGDVGQRVVRVTGFSRVLEWVLMWCLLEPMMDSHCRLRHSVLRDPHSLRRRLRAAGLLLLVLSPFLSLFLLTLLLLRKAEQLYHQPAAASTRAWSNAAKWTLRAYNESDHESIQRLDRAALLADDFLSRFPTPLLSLAAKLVAFLAGSLAALLLVLAVLDEHLLELSLLGHSLVWYAAVCGAVLAAVRPLAQADKGVAAAAAAAAGAPCSLQRVCECMGYAPERWRGVEGRMMAQQELLGMYQFKILLLLEDLLSVFTAPYFLLFVLPERAESLLSFIRSHTVSHPSMGDICSCPPKPFACTTTRDCQSAACSDAMQCTCVSGRQPLMAVPHSCSERQHQHSCRLGRCHESDPSGHVQDAAQLWLSDERNGGSRARGNKPVTSNRPRHDDSAPCHDCCCPSALEGCRRDSALHSNCQCHDTLARGGAPWSNAGGSLQGVASVGQAFTAAGPVTPLTLRHATVDDHGACRPSSTCDASTCQLSQSVPSLHRLQHHSSVDAAPPRTALHVGPRDAMHHAVPCGNDASVELSHSCHGASAIGQHERRQHAGPVIGQSLSGSVSGRSGSNRMASRSVESVHGGNGALLSTEGERGGLVDVSVQRGEVEVGLGVKSTSAMASAEAASAGARAAATAVVPGGAVGAAGLPTELKRGGVVGQSEEDWVILRNVSGGRRSSTALHGLMSATHEAVESGMDNRSSSLQGLWISSPSEHSGEHDDVQDKCDPSHLLEGMEAAMMATRLASPGDRWQSGQSVREHEAGVGRRTNGFDFTLWQGRQGSGARARKVRAGGAQSGSSAGGATAASSATLPAALAVSDSGDSSSWVWQSEAGEGDAGLQSLVRAGGHDGEVVQWEASNSKVSSSIVRVGSHSGVREEEQGGVVVLQEGGPWEAHGVVGDNDLSSSHQGIAAAVSQGGAMVNEGAALSATTRAVEAHYSTGQSHATSSNSWNGQGNKTNIALLSSSMGIEISTTVAGVEAGRASSRRMLVVSSGMSQSLVDSSDEDTPSLFPPLPFADVLGEDVDV